MIKIAIKVFLLLIPLVFLVFYMVSVSVVLPDYFLKNHYFMPVDKTISNSYVFEQLQKYKAITLISNDKSYSLTYFTHGNSSKVEQVLSSFNNKPDYADLTLIYKTAITRLKLFEKLVFILAYHPQTWEIDVIKSIQNDMKIPVEIAYNPEVAVNVSNQGLLLSISYDYDFYESKIYLTAQFSNKIIQYDSIDILVNNQKIASSQMEIVKKANYQLKFVVAQTSNPMYRVVFKCISTDENTEIPFTFVRESINDPPLLMVSNSSQKTVLDTLFMIKRVSLNELQNENMYKYNLVIFNGITLKDIPENTSRILSQAVSDDVQSLFFVSAAQNIGKKGDNETLESILPIELVPKSLKYVPPVAMLVMLDVSSSMLGDKLSIAKVISIELLNNLKEEDKLALYIFWDDYKKIYDFTNNRNTEYTYELEPLTVRGGTDMHKPLAIGVNELSKVKTLNKHVIIISDGMTKEADFDTIIQFALVQGITISSIGIGDELNTVLLKKLALTTGGNYYEANSLEEIPAIIVEDRKNISRPAFINESFTIYDFFSSPQSIISGMNIITPKDGTTTLFQNQYEDPLFIYKKNKKHSVSFFLSDLYGNFTDAFLQKKYVQNILREFVKKTIQKETTRISISEANRRIYFSVASNYLIQPLMTVYYKNRILKQLPMSDLGFNNFMGGMSLPYVGEYLGVIEDRDRMISKCAFYYNGDFGGIDYEAHRNLLEYEQLQAKQLSFKSMWLLLFFLCSLIVTLYYKQRRS